MCRRYLDTLLLSSGCGQGEVLSKEILILRWVLTSAEYGVNKVTLDFIQITS